MDGTPGARVYSSLIFSNRPKSVVIAYCSEKLFMYSCRIFNHGGTLSEPCYPQQNQVQVIYYIMYLFTG